MNNAFKSIPESVAGFLYIIAGTIILLDALGAIQAGLLVFIGAIFLIWHGFVLLNGPQRISMLINKFQKKR